MARTSGTQAPRLDAIRLDDLIAGDSEALEPHDVFEGLRFECLDIAGRTLSGIQFRECVFDDVQAHDAVLRGATFSDVEFTRLNAPIFSAPRAELRSVTIDGSRLGSAELYESALSSVHVSSSKLGFVNLSGATLLDVLFTGCSIDELDLSSAKLNRVAFVDCTIGALSLHHATLVNVDLRRAEFSRLDGFTALAGATLSSGQVADLASSFAEHLGIRVED
ncbi:Uncharacterized protein YjbI, contains pentapeptide repeats [Agreia bicolorata]|uniref:Uncharacterized protein YjbI, contains pentapeptide repeats n=1 Tax=Agreia bicolorata TaxID=110935 RepID=A0A1T4WQP3_9MICO|nr:pentapeptide repeat-containing protein [Agreia bicolorata]SKA79663.1 Uncharacterized protein YjbI, contains pentapeptide repeats [Agreia bicolorata]